MSLRRTLGSIFVFWVPLAATWLMMSLEGPLLAAIIARLADPKFNLAAHGVAYAWAILVEAPVIMIMSASTALATSAIAFRRLRAFTYGLNVMVTLAMLVVLIPPVFRFLMQGLIGLPPEVADLTYLALWILLPWPGAIGYRRFYQGLLIRSGRTRLVAYGTVLRLLSMAGTALVLYFVARLPGAAVGAAALSAGVCLEAVSSRFMARRTVRELLATEEPAGSSALGYGRIWEFYYPLALTSVIGLAVQPLLTFFMGRAASPVESLAVYPVVHALSFMFRALGLSYQEAAIALMGDRFEHHREVGRFAAILGVGASVGLALIAFTPLAGFWFETISGLTPTLADFAIWPTRVLVILPALSVLLSYQRAILVVGRRTAPVTWATASEVLGVGVLFTVLGGYFGIVGVVAATLAFVGGRISANLFLLRPCLRAVRS
ncbi:MAG TPA: hypothetical protein VGA22_07870 [Gemmatimonadales bacterium]